MSDYTEELAQWRRKREETLVADDGWLCVAGLHWLEPGENIVERHVFQLDGDSVLHDGVVLRPDVDKIANGEKTLFVIVRGPKIGLRVLDKQSAFRRDFKGLEWYRAKTEYLVEGRLLAYAEPRDVSMATVIGVDELYKSPGVVEFELHGQTCRLEPVISAKQRLFFVMRDLTAGRTTYGASRFLYADPPVDGKVLLDFNRAYSPPCAFTPFATCPLPPTGNVLAVAVEAGERYKSSESTYSSCTAG